jgi:hypothetical protein
MTFTTSREVRCRGCRRRPCLRGSERRPSRLVRRITRRPPRRLVPHGEGSALRILTSSVPGRRVLEEDVGRCADLLAGSARRRPGLRSQSSPLRRLVIEPSRRGISSPGTRICGRSESAKAPLTPEPHVEAARTSCMRPRSWRRRSASLELSVRSRFSPRDGRSAEAGRPRLYQISANFFSPV